MCRYDDILPSANLRDRRRRTTCCSASAASKVMTRPDSSHVRNYLNITIDGNGQLNANVGNPYLKPATAWRVRPDRGMVLRQGRLADVQRVLQGREELLLPERGGFPDHQQRGDARHPDARAGELRRPRQDQGLRSRVPADVRFPAGLPQRPRYERELLVHRQLGPAEHVTSTPARRSTSRPPRPATCRSKACRSTTSTRRCSTKARPLDPRGLQLALDSSC